MGGGGRPIRELRSEVEADETISERTRKELLSGLEIKDNRIKLQSDSLIILGKVYSVNFRF